MKPVILGAGLAGLSSALALAPRPVVVVSPCAMGEGCSTAWAQGGIAAAIGKDDQPSLHVLDTLAAGNGLGDSPIITQTINDAKDVIDRLVKYGVEFDRDECGALLFGLEAAHCKSRIVHAKDSTGLIVIQALIEAARSTPSIEIIENAQAIDLIVENGAIGGVVLDCSERSRVIDTNCVILASGGASALWRDTTNPHQNWGSGLALAAKAGATLSDLEFLQFHPTAIDIGKDPMPLASEALRGAGAQLINEKGDRFIDELQPRDIVARAIWDQYVQGHKVFLDARQSIGKAFASRFPAIYAMCLSATIDPVTDPIPIRVAAHYHMGGVYTDLNGRTNVKGLWACGEVACTGLHGANRLASNSLLEAASFGWRVAKDIENNHNFAKEIKGSKTTNHIPRARCPFDPHIRTLMSENVGVIRNATGLQRAIDFLAPLAKTSDMALTGLMISFCALRREESRGAHYRSDFPNTYPTAQRNFFRLNDLEAIL